MSKRTQVFVAALLFLLLSFPIAAQADLGRHNQGPSWQGAISWSWDQIAQLIHVSAIKRPINDHQMGTKSRGACDPNGITACVPDTRDARSACDPNGSTACTNSST
jgi:hypothetical protein